MKPEMCFLFESGNDAGRAGIALSKILTGLSTRTRPPLVCRSIRRRHDNILMHKLLYILHVSSCVNLFVVKNITETNIITKHNYGIQLMPTASHTLFPNRQ